MSTTYGRCIGLIGGLGPAATTYYYRSLLLAHEELGAKPELVIVHADVNRVLEFVRDNDLAGLADYLAGMVERLRSAGAKMIAIPAVTPHICVDRLSELISLPLVSILDVIKSALLERNQRRVTLFGTRSVMASALFGTLEGYDVVQLNCRDLDRIDKNYLHLVLTGKLTSVQVSDLLGIANLVLAHEKLDAVILAGTELAMMDEWERLGSRIINAPYLHVREITRHALAD